MTIWEMAVAYGHKHMGCCNIEDYEAGAKDALDEIEKCFSQIGLCRDVYDYVEVCDSIKKKIKELRGKK